MNIACKVLMGVLLGIMALAADKAPSPNWPQWQGPRRDNFSTDTGLLKKWPDGGPPLVWKATGMGRGYSGVAIADGKIYTMGDIDGSSCVIALDSGGKILWTSKIGPDTGNKNYPGTRSTPTIDGDKLYVLTQGGDVACVNAADGNVVWRRNLINEFAGEMVTQWGYCECVLVDDNKVICNPGSKDGAFLALDKNTGDQVWRNKEITDKGSYSSFILATIGGQKQYIKLDHMRLAALKPEDGSILWQALRHRGGQTVPTPIVRGNDIWVTSGGGGSELYHVDVKDGKFSASKVYANDYSDNHSGDVVVGDYIYGCAENGVLKCMRWADGKEMWTAHDTDKASITAADGRLYLRDEKKTMYLIEATPESFKLISRFDPPDRAKGVPNWSHPIVCGGFLYLRDQDVLLCYDVRQK